jgi:hypothetical protein
MAEVCMRALCFEREGRYATAAALADALEAAARSVGIVPAVPRAVASLFKELDLESVISSGRVLRAEVATLAAAPEQPGPAASPPPPAERPTVPERGTPPRGYGMDLDFSGHSFQVSAAGLAAPRPATEEPPRALVIERVMPASSRRRSPRQVLATLGGLAVRALLMSVGVVALSAVFGWLFTSLRAADEGSARTIQIVVPPNASLPSLQPASAVILPPAPSIEGAVREASTPASPAPASTAAEAPRSKRAGDSVAGAVKTPLPSATAFRPREL